jgi:3-isopropylmalate/(R)-2-methylmalate dehydratase small subunit
MSLLLRGNVHKYGDNVDTDVIIPARYCTSFHGEDLAPHCLEDLDSNFVDKVKTGDILVAGNNFGCGSSRENAPIAIKSAGIACVIAKSFARIFYRNAINIALPILESAECVDITDDGDTIEVNLNAGEIINITKQKKFHIPPFPSVIQEIIKAGGMEAFVRSRIKPKKR